MKHINRYIINPVLVVALLFIGHSCIDLEEDLSSVLLIDQLKSENEVVAALTSVYRNTQKTYAQPHKLRVPTYGSDDLTTWWAGNKAPLRIYDGFNYGGGENADNAWMQESWDHLWKSVYYTNTLIQGLKTATVSAEVVKVADAEARFHRALAYFHLVRIWGNVPANLEESVLTGEEPRSTVLNNYNHIEADLLIAEAGLPAPGANAPGRLHSGAAKALLADLYLTWGGWPVKDATKYQMAADKAKEVVDMGYFELLAIDQLWLFNNQNSKEAVFSVQFSEDENLGSAYASAFSFHMARGWSDAYPELQFFNDFPAGPRKDATFVTDIPNRGVSAGQIVDKDPATIPWADSERMHPMYKKFTLSENLNVGNRVASFRSFEVIRYAEVLLIFAEAQARGDGETAASLDALNQIKRRAAGLPYNTPDVGVDVTTATAEEIVAERGWELAGEHKRWYDLIRTENLEAIALDRDPTENVPLTKQPTKDNYISPIPARFISSNVIQNPAGFVVQ